MTDHYVYFIREHGIGKGFCGCKIGVSTDPDFRLARMQTDNPRVLSVEARIGPLSRKEAYAMEKRLHKAFGKWRVRGEWFKLAVLKNMHRIYDHAAYDRESRTKSRAARKEWKEMRGKLRKAGIAV